MSSETDGFPILPHLGSEFMLWLWFHSEQHSAVFNFTQSEEDGVDLDAIPSIDLWIDERIAMRKPTETRVSAVLTGDNPAASKESHAALAGGKVLQELRIGFRLNDREYYTTLKGPELMLHSTRLPTMGTLNDSGDALHDLVIERMLLLQDLDRILSLLYREFCLLRTSPDWFELSGQIREWALSVYE